MTVLVWALPALAVAVGWALRARSGRRRLHAARTLAAQWEWIAGRAQADRDHLAWLLRQCERDRDEWAGIARAWQDRAVAHTMRPPVIVGTVAVDGVAAYAAALEAVDGMLDQMGVGE